MFFCAYFPFSRFVIRSFCLFSIFSVELGLPTFRFLGLELAYFPFSRFELGFLCLFSVFSVWN